MTDRTNGELGGKLQELVARPDTPYAPNRLTVAEQWTTLSHSVPMPTLGNTGQVERVIGEALEMVKLIDPLVNNSRGNNEEVDH